MSRYAELKSILDSGRYFKVVCGAGNEDPVEVYKLCIIYTLAGAHGIDLSANEEVVRAGMRGIDRAFELAPELGIELTVRPFINVSVGLKGDPHVRKALIRADDCIACGSCLPVCDQLAIQEGEPYAITTARCIGCGNCAEVCPNDAIEFFTRKVDFNDIIPRCLAAGAENVELHAIIPDDEAVMQDWKTIAALVPDQFISMCIDRSELSNKHFASRMRQAKEVAGDRLMIQADGAPMSGGPDTFRTTLQAVACAELTEKTGIPCKILLSGGTNSKTGELAGMCGLTVHGVSIGTFARNLVREELALDDFDTNLEAIRSSVAKGVKLVQDNLKYIAR
jgi:Pyruvate/2-oxoacid:ferredoxin oxidoreductase delta subunit